MRDDRDFFTDDFSPSLASTVAGGGHSRIFTRRRVLTALALVGVTAVMIAVAILGRA